MTSVVINLASGYFNAVILLVIEILMLNILSHSVRKRLESYYVSRSLMEGRKVPLRQISILGIDARRDRTSLTLAIVMLGVILSFGVMEWGVNGETGTKRVTRSGFVYGGDNAIGNISRTSLEPRNSNNSDIDNPVTTYGRLDFKPTGKQREIMEKCSSIGHTHKPNSEIEVDLFMRKAAVTIEESSKIDKESFIAMNISNSEVNCIGNEDDVKVTSAADECSILSRNDSFLRTGPYLDGDGWSEECQCWMWNSYLRFQFWTENVTTDPCLEKKGFTERYFLRVSTRRHGRPYVVWDVHRTNKDQMYRYRLFPVTINGRGIGPSIDFCTGHEHEISSRFKLGHSIILAAVSASNSVWLDFPTELRDVFYSNLGSTKAYDIYTWRYPLKAESLLGENGTQRPIALGEYPFYVSVPVTRVDLWSIISFFLLLVLLIGARIVGEFLWFRIPLKVDASSTEWLGELILKEKTIREDCLHETSSAYLELMECGQSGERSSKVTIVGSYEASSCGIAQATSNDDSS